MPKYTIDRLNDCLAFAGFNQVDAAWASQTSLTGGSNLASEIARLEVHYGLDEIVKSQFARTLKWEALGDRLAAVEAHQEEIMAE